MLKSKSRISQVLDFKTDQEHQDYISLFQEAMLKNIINFSKDEMNKILNVYESNYKAYMKYKIDNHINPIKFIEFMAAESVNLELFAKDKNFIRAKNNEIVKKSIFYK